MENKLQNKKIAIVVTHGFEHSEFEKPFQALKKEGAEIDVISIQKGPVRSWKDKDWGDEIEATQAIGELKSEDYDALVLPGGVINSDQLRMNKEVVSFVKEFVVEKKPIAAICHGAWTLIETGLMKGRRMTSWPSLKTDLENAGVEWTDDEVVVDRGLVSSRKPSDLSAFCEKMIEEIREGVHQ
jgi:protease I